MPRVKLNTELYNNHTTYQGRGATYHNKKMRQTTQFVAVAGGDATLVTAINEYAAVAEAAFDDVGLNLSQLLELLPPVGDVTENGSVQDRFLDMFVKGQVPVNLWQGQAPPGATVASVKQMKFNARKVRARLKRLWQMFVYSNDLLNSEQGAGADVETRPNIGDTETVGSA